MKQRHISITDFVLAQEAWGLPDNLHPALSYLRTVWQIWDRSGRDFDELVIRYKRGGRVTIPVPKIREGSDSALVRKIVGAFEVHLQDED